MMYLKHAKGNLITMGMAGTFDVIVHGCNCFNTMGSGIAREIRERLPAAFEVDQKTTIGDINKLGNMTVAHVENASPLTGCLTVINAYTQYTYGSKIPDFNLNAFKLILDKITQQGLRNRAYGFPLIGSGLGQGDPVAIRAALEEFAGIQSEFYNSTVTLVEFQP